MSDSIKKILIVEDDVSLLDILADRLSEKRTFQVFKAQDGEEAIKYAIDQKPDLVLLDLLLPKLDGFEVLERIRKYPDKEIASTKVIVLSNLWSDKDILRAQALKIDEYYVKANTNIEEIFTRVEQIFK